MTPLTLEQAVDEACPSACAECGTNLPRPGEECAACGELPALLRAEAAEQLTRPGVLAAARALQCRREAFRLSDEQARMLLEADRLDRQATLEQALDKTEAELAAATARKDQAEAALKEPRCAEARAGRERAEAAAVRQEYDLAARKADRLNKGPKAVIEARAKLSHADTLLAEKDAVLATAKTARAHAEAAFEAAAQEVRRLATARDNAASRLSAPPETRLSPESLEALCAPAIGVARAVFDLRMQRPGNRLTADDLLANDFVTVGLGIAEAIALLTGVADGKFVDGKRAGAREAEAGMKSRPRLVGDTVVPPGSVDVRGGVLAPGVPPEARPRTGLFQAPRR